MSLYAENILSTYPALPASLRKLAGLLTREASALKLFAHLSACEEKYHVRNDREALQYSEINGLSYLATHLLSNGARISGGGRAYQLSALGEAGNGGLKWHPREAMRRKLSKKSKKKRSA
jgi:hypothetical protein